jgi:hypothetical protein
MMNDQDKSVILAKAAGWHIRVSASSDGIPDCIFMDAQPVKVTDDYKLYPGDEHEDALYRRMCPDLYRLENFELAWRIKQWAHEEDDRCMVTQFATWYERHALRLSRLSPSGAAREWLDAILFVAIIVEVDDE